MRKKSNDEINKFPVNVQIKYLIKYKYRFDGKEVFSPEQETLADVLQLIHEKGKEFFKDGIIIRRIVIDEEYLI